MNKSLISTAATLLFAMGLAAGCGHKQPPPASTSTTKTETSTVNSAGEKSNSEVTERRVERQDGSQEVQTTTSTTAVTPPPGPAPAPAPAQK